MNEAQSKFLKIGLVVIALALHMVFWEWQFGQLSTPDIVVTSKQEPRDPKNKRNPFDGRLAAEKAGYVHDPSKQITYTGLKATGFRASPNRVMYSSLLGIVLPLLLVGGAVFLHLGRKP